MQGSSVYVSHLNTNEHLLVCTATTEGARLGMHSPVRFVPMTLMPRQTGRKVNDDSTKVARGQAKQPFGPHV
jgi:hypothetical protein